MMAPQVFLDTAYAVALASRTDEHHTKAQALAQHIATHQVQVVTTRAVCLEVGDALSRLRARPTAIRFLENLEAEPSVEIIPASETLCAEAFNLYRQRADKEWGLTDCLAFVVMKQRGLTEALTTDEHFEQASSKPCSDPDLAAPCLPLANNPKTSPLFSSGMPGVTSGHRRSRATPAVRSRHQGFSPIAISDFVHGNDGAGMSASLGTLGKPFAPWICIGVASLPIAPSAANSPSTRSPAPRLARHPNITLALDRPSVANGAV